MRFTLRHLEVLEAVLRTGSTLAAAESLHVTQPVISRTIKHAEQRLGYPLFHRRRGRLVPTSEVEALVPELSQFFAHWRRIQDYAENLVDRTVVLRAAVNPALIDVLPQSVLHVNQQMSGVRFQLLTLHTGEMVDQLLAGQLDLGVCQGCSPPSGAAAEELARGDLVMLVPRSWSNGDRVGAAWMNGKPFIGVQKGYGLGEIVDDYLTSHGLEPAIVVQVATYQLAVSLVERGLGATIVDQFTAETADEALVQRVPLSNAPSLPIHVLHHPRHVPGKAENLLREGIIRTLTQ